MSSDQFQQMANHQSGLLGVSDASAVVRDVLARVASVVGAVEAIDLFCDRVRMAIGSLSAALSGLGLLVVSGGIGASSPVIHRRTCEGLE
jgi:acetate kinase